MSERGKSRIMDKYTIAILFSSPTLSHHRTVLDIFISADTTALRAIDSVSAPSCSGWISEDDVVFEQYSINVAKDASVYIVEMTLHRLIGELSLPGKCEILYEKWVRREGMIDLHYQARHQPGSISWDLIPPEWLQPLKRRRVRAGDYPSRIRYLADLFERYYLRAGRDVYSLLPSEPEVASFLASLRQREVAELNTAVAKMIDESDSLFIARWSVESIGDATPDPQAKAFYFLALVERLGDAGAIRELPQSHRIDWSQLN